MMLVYRRQLEAVVNQIDGELEDHGTFLHAFDYFVDNASGGDLYKFVNALKRNLELVDKPR